MNRKETKKWEQPLNWFVVADGKSTPAYNLSNTWQIPAIQIQSYTAITIRPEECEEIYNRTSTDHKGCSPENQNVEDNSKDKDNIFHKNYKNMQIHYDKTWWRHQLETFFALLALCVRGIHWSPVNSPHKRPVTLNFDIFFDLCLNKRPSKQSRHRWIETASCSLWRHCNVIGYLVILDHVILTLHRIRIHRETVMYH